jgi:heat shock protein HspQ
MPENVFCWNCWWLGNGTIRTRKCEALDSPYYNTICSTNEIRCHHYVSKVDVTDSPRNKKVRGPRNIRKL